MKSGILMGCALAAGCLSARSASADSPEGWADWNKEVAAVCKAAVSEEAQSKAWRVEVATYGSESYGMAILTTPPKAKAPAKYVCVMDKQTKKIEIYGGAADSWTVTGP